MELRRLGKSHVKPEPVVVEEDFDTYPRTRRGRYCPMREGSVDLATWCWSQTLRDADQLARCSTPIRLIATDAVFSMDGDLAPLPELLALAESFDAFERDCELLRSVGCDFVFAPSGFDTQGVDGDGLRDTLDPKFEARGDERMTFAMAGRKGRVRFSAAFRSGPFGSRPGGRTSDRWRSTPCRRRDYLRRGTGPNRL